MRQRYLASLGSLAALLALITLAAVLMGGQAPPSTVKPTPAQKAGSVPKTPWGDPDLQGTWFVTEGVPLERSPQNANKPLLTDAEVAALDKEKAVNPGRNARSENSSQDVT